MATKLINLTPTIDFDIFFKRVHFLLICILNSIKDKYFKIKIINERGSYSVRRGRKRIGEHRFREGRGMAIICLVGHFSIIIGVHNDIIFKWFHCVTLCNFSLVNSMIW